MKAFYFSLRLFGRGLSKQSIAPCKLTSCRQLSIPAAPVQPTPVKSAPEADKAVSKIAVITGGSTGIGMECAAVFSGLGWEVHNISRYLSRSSIYPVCISFFSHFPLFDSKPCPVEGVISHTADLTSSTEASRVGNIIAG
jgi:hypothetical protein